VEFTPSYHLEWLVGDEVTFTPEKQKRVLLTGAGGFVGHHTLEHLLENTDWEIICTDSFRHRGKTDRIREVVDGRIDRARVKVLTHDLRAPISPQLAHAIGPIDYLISMASDSHVDRSISDPRTFIENNVQLVLTLLEYAREHPVKKFLHVSTDEVYGPAFGSHLHYEGEPHRPSNPYSASKAAQEDICYSYWRTYGLPIGISNTMNIIGERQDPEKFVPLVLSKVLKGETVEIHSQDGKPGSRFYLHARNQADALLFLLNNVDFPVYGDMVRVPCIEVGAWAEKPAQMGRWNVVGEEEVDNQEMALAVGAYVKKPAACYQFVDFHNSRPGHDLRYALDGTKMRELGWQPPVPLWESLERTVRWSLDHPEWLA
jgi:dTDP-glucose 4,6-dehydratase